jgi:hypothetical protein
MKKSIYALTATIAFITFFNLGNLHAEIGRTPSVEPIVEVDIEDTKNEKGFDFNASKAKARIPANIVTKSESSPISSYLGPLIFLLTLPIAIWLVISKKIKSNPAVEKKVDYFPKTQQFNPYKTDYQQSAEDDDDIDFPKAS